MLSLSETVNPAVICSYRSSSRSIPQWLGLFKNLEWSGLCLLHTLRHTSLMVKRHSVGPYLLFLVNWGSTKQFTESVFVAAIRWNGAWILENKYPAKAGQTLTLLAYYYRPGHLKHRYLFPKRRESKHTIQYPRDPVWCTSLNGLLYVSWSSSRL